MIIATVILATLLESPDIGEFFSLGSWLDSKVLSTDTLGSDSDNIPSSRWVILKDVPKVTEEHTIQMPAYFHIDRYYEGVSTNATKLVRQPFWDGTGWYVGESVMPGGIALDAYASYDQSDGDLWWSSWLNDKSYKEVTYNAKAIRYKDVIEYTLETNRLYCPKMVRLSPGNQSAVLSSFAGFMERSYYAGLGMSNVWDEATYGPTDPTSNFWFDVDGGGFHYEPTERVIDTRRLTDGRNIYRLFRALREASSSWDFRATRPSWGDDRMLWAFRGLAIPKRQGLGNITDQGLAACVFDWTHNLVSFPWEERIVPLATSYSDDNGWGGDYYDSESENPILRDALLQVYFGEPENKPYTQYQSNQGRMRLQALYANGTTFTDILTNVYPRSCDIITNREYAAKSKRLFAEQTGISCQALSLLDRSYYEVTGYYEYPVTSFVYRANNSQTGVVTADSVTINVRDGTATLDTTITGDDLSWIGDDYIVTTNTFGSGHYRSLFSHFGGIKDSLHEYPLTTTERIPVTLNEEDIIMAADGFYEDWDEVLVDLNNYSKSGSAYMADGRYLIIKGGVTSSYSQPVSCPLSLPVVVSNLPMRATIGIERAYEMRETVENPRRSIGGLNHPGPAAWNNGRVVANLVLGISGFSHSSHFNDPAMEVSENRYGEQGFESFYSTRLYIPTRRSPTIIPFVETQSLLDHIRGLQRDYIGVNDPLHKPQDVIPITVGSFNLIKTNTVFNTGLIHPFKQHEVIRVTLKRINGEVAITSVEAGSYSRFGEFLSSVQIPLPLDYLALEVSFGNENELPTDVRLNGWRGPNSYTGHTAYMQQVDWNWKTLKYTKEQ